MPVFKVRSNNFCLAIVIFNFCFLALTGFFCGKSASAAADGMIISEILVGMSGNSKYEFVELYNSGSEAVDLAGWMLKKKTAAGTESNLVSAAKMAGTVAPGSYFVIAHPDYLPQIGADLAYSGASYAIAANNTVLLYDRDGGLADKVGWGEAGDFAGAPAENPPNNFSLNRPDNNNTGNNAADFRTGIPSPGLPYDESSEYIDPLTGAGQTRVSTSSAVVKKGQELWVPAGAVVINELMIEAPDDEKQWLELFNRTSQVIDLDGWYVELDSGARTYLKGQAGLDDENHVLVTDLVGTLKTRGGSASLRLKSGALIDQVVYGDFNDGFVLDNAPPAAYPASLARRRDGLASNYAAWDWAATFAPTPGQANMIVDRSGQTLPGPVDHQDCGLRLNEVLPYPDEGEEEFIEIENTGPAALLLDGFSVENISRQTFFLSGRLLPGERRVWPRAESGLAFLNDGDQLLLRALDGGLCQIMSYPGALPGQAWAYDRESRQFVWTLQPSPGLQNIIILPNRPPVAAFSFSEPQLARPLRFLPDDTFDPDGDDLSYFWDFADGFTNILPDPEHTFFQAGEYEVVLTVSDGELSATATRLVLIPVPDIAETDPAARTDDDRASMAKTLLISELMPDPVGADAGGEWIELYNYGDQPLKLLGWSLSTQSGQTYKFPDIEVDSRDFIVLPRPESRLALNNAAGSLSLSAPDEEEIDSTEYAGAKEGYSWSRDENGDWYWSRQASPGTENIIVSAPVKMAAVSAAVKANANNSAVADVDLAEVRHLPLGSKIRTSGVVAVLPGVLGKQFFYIAGSSGLQVYSHKQDYPVLHVGDLVSVSGELSQNQGEVRLKTKSRGDIAVLAQSSPPQPLVLSCADVNPDHLGELLEIRGEVTSAKASGIFLDDGTDEVLVFVKTETGISSRAVQVGDRIKVSGILSSTQSGLRLLPRQVDDLEIIDRAGSPIQVLGASTEVLEWELPAARTRPYALIFIAFLAILGLIAIISIRRKKGR